MVTGTALTPPQSSVAAAPAAVTPAPAPVLPLPQPTTLPDMPAGPRQLDTNGKPIAAFLRDRRIEPRRPSGLPLFSEMSEEYLDYRTLASPSMESDIGTARFQRDIFIELIGDHPVDTYNTADLQAYVHLLTFWPAEETERRSDWTARQIIENNRDLHLRPLMRDEKVDGRIRHLQVGHAVGGDEHEGYGRQTRSEKHSRLLAMLPLNPDIDFSMFQNLHFDVMAKRKRTRGRQPKG